MKVFGPRPWGIALDDPSLMTDTPIGAECLRCGERIDDGDSGVLMPHCGDGGALWRAQHVECHARALVGSVGHQRRRCSCYGGSEEDPPGMTSRQAARAAFVLARSGIMQLDDDAADEHNGQRQGDTGTPD